MLSVLCPFLSTMFSVCRSQAALQVEIVALRHQIGVLRRSAKKRPKLTVADRVPGELKESRGDWSLVQPSTVPPPLVRIERYWCHRSVNSRLWQASFQPRMRSMAIIVMLKIEQLRLEIGRRPE